MIGVFIWMVILLALILFLRNQAEKYETIRKLPTPTVLEQIRFLFFNKSSEFSENVQKLFDKYGDTFQITIMPSSRLVVTAHAPLVNKILRSKDHLEKPQFSNKCLVVYLGEGIATAPVEKWKADRSVISKMFNQVTTDKFIRTTDLACTRLIDAIRRKVGERIDIQSIMRGFTIDAVMESMQDSRSHFKLDVDAYTANHETFFECLIERLYSPSMYVDFLHRFTKNFQMSSQSAQYMKDATEQLVASQHDLDPKDTSNLVTSIMESNTISYNRRHDNITTLMEAAFDTTSSTSTLALYEMARNLDIQEKAFEEIISIVGDDTSRKITFNETKQMKHLENVINETLRFYTIVNWNQRVTGEDIPTDDGFVLPKGVTIAIFVSSIHMSEKYYDNPKVFNPDRWDRRVTTFQQGAFLPFSLGPRDCLGKHVAMHLIKVILANVIRNYRLSLPSSNEKLVISNQPVASSINGVHVIFNERQKTTFRSIKRENDEQLKVY